MVLKKIRQLFGLGRRKEAVARVFLRKGKGKIIVNKQPIDQYFPSEYVIKEILAPLIITGMVEEYDIITTIKGGGFAAQADALKLGIANALMGSDKKEFCRPIFKKHGLLTTDSRVKERKKYGLKKARKASQFSKR